MKDQVLHGRSAEQAEMDRLLQAARAGSSGALAVRGEAGIGKSALLDYAAEMAVDMHVRRVCGVENEAGLPFAALHFLLRHDFGFIEDLPPRQQAALRSALGMADVRETDPFLVGLALLSFLTALARDRPLLLLVDDVQWLDGASVNAILFAARRLGSNGTAVMFAVQEPAPDWGGDDLPALRLEGLPATAAEKLLRARAPFLTEEARERVLDRAQGNPLALMRLPGEQPDWPVRPPSPEITASTTPGWVDEAFLERIRRLPVRTRDALLVLAADDTGDPRVITRAVRDLGLSAQDLEPAEQAELVRLHPASMTFPHPLIRTTVYHAASLARRLAVHRALAAACDGAGFPDRRAWHLSAGSAGTDEAVAAELEHAAASARERGGHAAAMLAYERAAALSGEERVRARRLIEAAMTAVEAGHLHPARMIAERAASNCAVPTEHARLAQVQALIEAERGSPRAAARILFEGAVRLDEPVVAIPMLAETGIHAWSAGDQLTLADAADRAEAFPPCPEPLLPLAEITRGLQTFMAGDVADGMSLLRMAVRGAERGLRTPLRLRVHIAAIALLIGQDELSRMLADTLVAECRRHGVTGLLPHALQVAAQARLFSGAYDDARRMAAEALRIARDAGQDRRVAHLSGIPAWLAAVAGEDTVCRELAAEGRTSQDNLAASAWAARALGLLDLGLGRCTEALNRLEELTGGQARHTLIARFSLPDHVEAAVRVGRPDLAKEPCARFEEYAEHSGRPWAQAIASRCRAMLCADEEAERHYLTATLLHRKAGRPFERARTELLFGEWLRRTRRRAEARPHLRSAKEIFSDLGARPWVERAGMELNATGDVDRRDRHGGLLSRLTPQELQVVRLASTGASNRDIATQLAISHRTVGYHLYKAFPKLGIASRAELPLLPMDR